VCVSVAFSSSSLLLLCFFLLLQISLLFFFFAFFLYNFCNFLISLQLRFLVRRVWIHAPLNFATLAAINPELRNPRTVFEFELRFQVIEALFRSIAVILGPFRRNSGIAVRVFGFFVLLRLPWGKAKEEISLRRMRCRRKLFLRR